jgi:hypothetical protein
MGLSIILAARLARRGGAKRTLWETSVANKLTFYRHGRFNGCALFSSGLKFPSSHGVYGVLVEAIAQAADDLYISDVSIDVNNRLEFNEAPDVVANCLLGALRLDPFLIGELRRRYL